ncbi:MAG: hypothetical protein ACRDRV_09645 [Pseudonocardiaceae bacterium]
MYVVIVAFDLKESVVEFPELRTWVRDKAAADYANLAGMRFKTWFSDERKRIWGAVYLVDSADAFDADKIPRLPDGRTGPVGTRPTSVTWFELEAFVTGPQGLAGVDDLLGAGLARQTEGIAR